MAPGKLPQMHRLAELLMYSVLCIFVAIGLFMLVQHVRGYSTLLPGLPDTDVLPVSAPGR